MAILIPDIEMPKSCSDCPCCYDYIYCTALSKGLMRDDDDNYYSELGIDIFETRFPDCQLIGVDEERVDFKLFSALLRFCQEHTFEEFKNLLEGKQ